MSVSDQQLLLWLSHSDAKVRNVSLDFLTGSFCQDLSLLSTVFAGWDRFGPAEAYSDFPLVSHLPIGISQVEECIQRAASMSLGRKIVDRECRCAGKLIESLVAGSPDNFVDFLDELEVLQRTSKVFFRVSIDSLRERKEVRNRPSHSLLIDLEDGDESVAQTALECLFLRGEAEAVIDKSLARLRQEEPPSSRDSAVLGLGQRYGLAGREAQLFPLIDNKHGSIADAATIGLCRLRSAETQRLIAERFSQLGRHGQLRAIEIVRRSRLPKSSELLRYLLPLGADFAVQDAVRIAEVMLFDFACLEDWLEALLLAETPSLNRIAFALSLVEPLGLESTPEDLPRIRELIRSRRQND